MVVNHLCPEPGLGRDHGLKQLEKCVSNSALSVFRIFHRTWKITRTFMKVCLLCVTFVNYSLYCQGGGGVHKFVEKVWRDVSKHGLIAVKNGGLTDWVWPRYEVDNAKNSCNLTCFFTSPGSFLFHVAMQLRNCFLNATTRGSRQLMYKMNIASTYWVS